jgi:hypothetical protein
MEQRDKFESSFLLSFTNSEILKNENIALALLTLTWVALQVKLNDLPLQDAPLNYT